MIRALCRQAAICTYQVNITRGFATGQHDNLKLWMVHKLKGESVSHTNTPHEIPSMLQRLREMGLMGNLRAIGNLDPPSSGLVMVTTSKSVTCDQGGETQTQTPTSIQSEHYLSHQN